MHLQNFLDKFCFVPVVDVKRSWVDKDLYQKYNLTSDEIHYVETTIKAMDGGDD